MKKKLSTVTPEEANELIKNLFELRQKRTNSKKSELEYERFREVCAKKFDFLVERKTRKYRSFANYEDLKQDGRVALMNAFESFKPGKGDFIYWANQYIKTKVSREANRHSTIKIPIKHTKHIQPYKVSQLPVIIDHQLHAEDTFESNELQEKVKTAIAELPQMQQLVIKMHYEFGSYKNQSISKICDELNISRTDVRKILDSARQSLKEKLQHLEE